MSSMSKVLAKLDADESRAPEPAAAEDVLAAGMADSSAEGLGDNADGSQFVPDPSRPLDMRPPVLGTPSFDINGETRAWDAARIDPVITLFHQRYAPISEQYRGVRARLLATNASQAAQAIVVTSAVPGEGKTAATINLGLALAEGGEHRVLIADADFRRTSVARMLGAEDRPGLADVLRGEATLGQALQPTPLPNLKLLPAGTVSAQDFSELLGGTNVATTLDDLRLGFHYVLLDTPPVTTVSDVSLLAPNCDGALVVVWMRRTPEPLVQQAIRTLQANNVKVLGCLLSRFHERGAN